MKKGKKSIITIILTLLLAVSGGVIYDNGSEAPQEEPVQLEVLQQAPVAEEVGEEIQEEVHGEVEEEVEEEIQEIVEEEIQFAAEPELTFRKEHNLTSHYEKHGIEMGFDSAEEYLEAANAVINNPDSLHKLEAEDGDDVYYLEATNEFVVVSKDGYIRTYFNPSGGLDYFNRQ